MNAMTLTAAGPRRWTTTAGQEWCNPRGGLWGGYAIGLALRVLEAEPDAAGEPLSITLTYAAQIPDGEVDIRLRQVRQGKSIGVWEVQLHVAGSDDIGVHAMVTMAVRPETTPFAMAAMPNAPDPETVPPAQPPFSNTHPSATLFERRPVDPRPMGPGGATHTLTWVRARDGTLDKAVLGMLADGSPPPMFSVVSGVRMSTTLTLTIYLHATVEELAEVGDDYILVEYDGRVGGRGATDERSSYWRRDGKLLATSEQLAWYRA